MQIKKKKLDFSGINLRTREADHECSFIFHFTYFMYKYVH